MQSALSKAGFLFASVAFSIALLTACAQKQDVIGKWQQVGKKSILEFHADGTFNAVDDMGMRVTGKYVLQETGDIRFEILHKGSSPEIIAGKVDVCGDELTFSTPHGKESEKYLKIKGLQGSPKNTKAPQ